MTMDSSAEFMQIFPASAKTILSWSYGEVKNPETFNYRSLKPEKGGLFCERIFGPLKDWECFCGKYRRVKHKGITCDRCGVEVTRSKVRRERMGHINLPVPVVHPWFLHRNKIISDLLNIEYKKMVQVVYFDAYLIIEMKDLNYTDFYPGQVISSEEYSIAKYRYGSRLIAKTGAEAVLTLLENFDLRERLKSSQDLIRMLENNEISNVLHKSKFIDRFNRQIKAIHYFLDNNIDPADMILTVLPVLPPDLRPLIPVDNGKRFITDDINELYRRVINRSNRLKNLLSLNTKELIILNEKRMLQEAVDDLIENGLYREAITSYRKRPLASLTHRLGTGREWRHKGYFARLKAGKMVDYSATTVAVPDSDLPDDTVLIPYKIAKVLLEPFLISELKRRGFAYTCRNAIKMITNDVSPVFSILEYLVPDFTVLVMHPPVFNNLRARFFRIHLTHDYALHLSPNAFYDMEFDKPSPLAKIFLPLSCKAQYEAKYLVDHPLRQRKQHNNARIMLKMMEYNAGDKPLLCPSCEYAGTLNELDHIQINTHIQLPGKIHTSLGGALLALEIPDILSPEKRPATIEEAEKILAETTSTPQLHQLLSRYSFLINYEDDNKKTEIFKDDYVAVYDWGLIGFQKLKFVNTLPKKQLNLESIYFSDFANLAYRTYCKNKFYHECSVKDCPAHGLSGKEKCLCSKQNGRLPCCGSAIGLTAVYKLIEFFAETESKSAVQMIYQQLLQTDNIIPDSTEELRNRFHFPASFPVKEFELLLTIKRQDEHSETDFFYHAARNAPETILNAVFKSQKISLTSPDAILFSGEKPETHALETTIKSESHTNGLSPSEWIDLLAAFPEMSEYCAWNKFNRLDFIALFQKCSMRLDYVSIAYSSRKLHINDWIDIFENDMTFFESQAKQIFTPEERKLISDGQQKIYFSDDSDDFLELPLDETDDEQTDVEEADDNDPDYDSSYILDLPD